LPRLSPGFFYGSTLNLLSNPPQAIVPPGADPPNPPLPGGINLHHQLFYGSQEPPSDRQGRKLPQAYGDG